jgi:ATP-binding cassette subfamily B protein
LSREAQARLADMGSEGGETLDAVRTVQAFAQELRASASFGEATERAFGAAVRRIGRRAIMTTLVIFIVFAAVGFLLWRGGHDVISGTISAGDLSAFIFYAVLVATSGGAISETIGDLQRASGAAERLAELRDEQPIIAEPAYPKSLPKPVLGAVAFDEVSFRYPTRPEQLALDRFDLSVVPGETVAIVGLGAGKTTVFSLLLRFYDPEACAIRVEGVDIRELALTDLRRALAIVPQEPVLFTATVADNIRYGRPDSTDAEVRAAADAASALSFIEALPQGFATDLGARGVRLSGGQRQRIAIARALLCNPAILLLDGDQRSTPKATGPQQALDRLMQADHLVIAHRLRRCKKPTGSWYRPRPVVDVGVQRSGAGATALCRLAGLRLIRAAASWVFLKSLKTGENCSRSACNASCYTLVWLELPCMSAAIT